MLRWRLIIAAAIIVPVLALCWLDVQHHFGRPGVWLFPIALLVACGGAAELLSMFRGAGLRPSGVATVGGTLLVVLAAGVPLLWTDYPPGCPIGKLGWPLLGLAAAVLLTFVVEMRRYRAPGGATVNIAAALLSCTYVGLLTSLLAHIRLIAGNVEGIFALVSLLVVVKLSDTGAYTVGRLVGRHKLAPTLSPGKTIEGAVGGFAFAVVGSWLFFYALVPALIGGDARGPAWWACLLYAVTLTAAGMVGDLAESLLKRDLGCKDSSRWLPGLGGVLDVMDSILAAAPVGYLWWASGWMTTG